MDPDVNQEEFIQGSSRSSMRRLSCLLLLLISISYLTVPSVCETVDLVQNGGFEDGLNWWMSFSYCIQLPRDGVTTPYRSHSGRCSLLTECSTGGEHCFGVGGGASQNVHLSKTSNLKLSFWVYLYGIPQINSWTDIALIADFWMPQARRTLVYYVAWAENIPIYTDFPLPTMASENVTNLLLHGLQCDKWNYVERNFEEDRNKAWPNSNLDTAQNVTITLIAVTFQRLSLTSKGAFWDDVSLTYDKASEPTTTPAPTPTETPPQTPPSTTPPAPPSPTPTQRCVIATTVYGSTMANEVVYMRHVRDDMIGSNEVGRLLVDEWNIFYYAWSPSVAQFIVTYDFLRPIFQVLLLPLLGIVCLTAYVYVLAAPLNVIFASVIASLLAAILSTTVYVVMPLVLIRTIHRKRLNLAPKA